MMRDALRDIAEPIDAVRIVREHVAAFADEAHGILQRNESAGKSRVMTLDNSRRRLSALSIRQDELLQEALDCVSHGLLRAAHVSAWQAFMDFLEEKMESDGLTKVRASRPKWDWSKLKTMEDIGETYPEYQLLEVARDIGLLSKSETRILHGDLATRNHCAHPSTYKPDLNETLGYVSGLINRIGKLQVKSL
jgi:hypothetical protein